MYRDLHASMRTPSNVGGGVQTIQHFAQYLTYFVSMLGQILDCLNGIFAIVLYGLFVHSALTSYEVFLCDILVVYALKMRRGEGNC